MLITISAARVCVTLPLTTEEATAWLASPAAITYWGHNALDSAGAHLRGAMAAGRAWDWSTATECLSLAYCALGAHAPEGETEHGAGYDWHRGTHPIQAAA